MDNISRIIFRLSFILACLFLGNEYSSADDSFNQVYYYNWWWLPFQTYSHSITGDFSVLGSTYKTSSDTIWSKSGVTLRIKVSKEGTDPQNLWMSIDISHQSAWIYSNGNLNGTMELSLTSGEYNVIYAVFERTSPITQSIRILGTYHVKLDNADPILTMSTTTDQEWPGTDLYISFNCTDNETGIGSVTIEKTFAGVTSPGNYVRTGDVSYPYSLQADGVGTYTITVNDRVGNSTTSAINVIDVTPPTLSHNLTNYTQSASGATTIYTLPVANQTNFTIDANEISGDSGININEFKYVRIINSSPNPPGEITINATSQQINIPNNSSLPSGDYQWVFNVKDNAGHAANSIEIQQRLLVRPPVISFINLPVPVESWYKTANLPVKASDDMPRLHAENPDIVRLYYSTDGKALYDTSKGWTLISKQGSSWTPYILSDDQSYIMIPFTEGKHTVDLKAVDEAGNITYEQKEFNVDTKSPELSLLVNGQGPTWAEGEIFYINSKNGISPISIADKTSGMQSLICVRDADTTIPLYSTTIPVASAMVYNFDPTDMLGEHTYSFILTDAAGNVTIRTFRLVYVPEPISVNDIIFEMTDENSMENPKATVFASNATGNFSNFKLLVQSQTSGVVQPASYIWTLDGATQTGGTFPATAPYTVNLIPGLIAEGEHTVSVTIVDQAGNQTDSSFSFVVDRTPPAITKAWIQIPDDGNDSSVFTISPYNETAIVVYQTGSDYLTTIAGAKKLWDKGAVKDQNGNVIQGNFALSDGVGIIYLVAVDDPAGNRREVCYTIVRPDIPQAPTLEKLLSDDFAFFSVRVKNNSLTTNVGGVSYMPVYQSVGVTSAAGTTQVEGASVIAAEGTSFSWNATDLGSSGAKAWSIGLLGYLKAWAVLTPAGAIDDSTIALKKIGTSTVYKIPNSPPHFANTGFWPEYMGANPAASYPVAVDPDGHTIWYRFKTVGSLFTWTSESSQGTAPAANWSLHLTNGGTVYLQAWADEGTPPSDEWPAVTIAEASHSYDTTHIDFMPPNITIGAPWASTAIWTKAIFSNLTAMDTGPSGLGSITVVLSPCNEDGTEDMASGRVKVLQVLPGLVSGSAQADLMMSIPSNLQGLYRSIATVTDRAGNTAVSSSNLARFDNTNPAIDNITITRPYNSTDAKYFADALGTLTAFINAQDEESGLGQWGYQQEGRDWVWSPWFGSTVAFTPDWSAGKNQQVRFAVRDKLGNESLPSTWSSVYFDKDQPEFELSITGLIGLDPGFTKDLNTLSVTLSPADLHAEWSLIRQLDDGTKLVSGGTSTWAQLVQNSSLWMDGGRYRIRVKVTNNNGVATIQDSTSFILDRTAPSPVTLELVPPTDRNRTSYYKNEPFLATWDGGVDLESPVNRVINLYQIIGGMRVDLNSITLGAGESQVSFNWGFKPIMWSYDNFFVEGVATNGTGAVIASTAVPVPVSSEGLCVYLPPYNSGTGMIALSWNPGTISGIANYHYQLWVQNTSDSPLGIEAATTQNSALVDLTQSKLAVGTKIYATIEAYNTDNVVIAKGASPLSLVDADAPVIELSLIPKAVTSSRVWTQFSTNSSISGIASAKWLIEKKSANKEWSVVPYSLDSNWRPIATVAGGEISANLSGAVSTGDLVRLTVMVENGAGRVSQASTGALPVDDTLPPVPLIVDQGLAINYTKQALTFNWQMSEIDPESGLDSYAYGWFFKGDAIEPGTWTPISDNNLSVRVDLRGTSNQALDGKILVLAVKAVNQAGLSTIGYSDGVILDSTAPLVYEVKVYTNRNKTTELSGYVKSSALLGRSVYLEIQALDEQSWVDGGTIYASTWDGTNNSWVTVGTSVAFTGSAITFAMPDSVSGFTTGSQWRFEGEAVDAAGNVSTKAISDGFLVEGNVPYVTNTTYSIDSKRINLTWNLSTSGDSRWLSHYTVVAQCGTKTQTIITANRTASFVWGSEGLGLASGDTVQFTVSAFSYTGTTLNSFATSDYQINITIDATPPVFDTEKTMVPLLPEASHWYDRIEGRFAYQADRGVSSLQWSAVLVPGEFSLVNWQDKCWASGWDFEKLFSAITSDSLSTWHGKQLRLKFRAANSMGIWSEITLSRAIAIDTTAPETSTLNRASAYSKETGEVTGWTLKLQDKQSGILEYMAILVPTSQVSGNGALTSYIWPDTLEVYQVSNYSPETETTINISIPLSTGTEGSFTPLIRVRNGTGHWSVTTGMPIIIDRTAPVPNILWTGASAQELMIDSLLQTVQVCNGPTQSVVITANEPVKCQILGTWLTSQILPNSGYTNLITTMLDFGTNPDGTLYPVAIDVEDQAGNHTVIDTTLRYNRAPAITIQTEALTVRPGVPIRLEDLALVTDEENDWIGDYPLSFNWSPGNGSTNQNWTGGTTLTTVFGTGSEHTTNYLQSPENAQTTIYTGTLAVTDKYNKSTTVSLSILVENTRMGTLAVNEFWSGPFEVRGWVVVPAGKTLSLSAAAVTVNAPLADGVMDAGILVQPGGSVFIINSTGPSSITTSMDGVLWKGIKVEGEVSGSGFTISAAERALILEQPGKIHLTASTLENNLIGVHLLSGEFDWNIGIIRDNEEYGVKEDGDGLFKVTNTSFSNNGVTYYSHELSQLSIAEVNNLAGNSGNQEANE